MEMGEEESSVEETSIKVAGGSGESGVLERDGSGCVDGDDGEDIRGTAESIGVAMVVTGVEIGVEAFVTRGDTYSEVCGCPLLLAVLLGLCGIAILETKLEVAGST